jgi:branched-chain amino acid transport system permease protein
MTTTAARPVKALEVEPRKAIRYGLVAGAVAVFASAIGMVETFNDRMLVDPVLSLGYASLLWIPLVFGYRVSKRVALEGVAAPKAGAGNVLSGALVGAVGGAVLGLFLVAIKAVNVRYFLINVTSGLRELLSFGLVAAPTTGLDTYGWSTAALEGAILLVVVGAALGALAGAMHLVNDRVRGAIVAGIGWVAFVAFTELVWGDIFGDFDLHWLDRAVFGSDRGVTYGAAAIVFAVAFLLNLRFRGGVRRVTARFQALPETTRRSRAFVAAVVLLVAGLALPSVFGSYLNEVLATVGLFMLMGIGLNVVVGFAGLLDLGYVAFFAVGAYTTAVLTSPVSPGISPELAFFEALPFVLLMAAIAGLIVGTPVIRMRGDYLAIVTLAFGEIARLVFQADWLKGTFGGAQGILKIGKGSIHTMFGYVVVAAGVIAFIVGFLRWWEGRRLDAGSAARLPGNSTKGMGLLIMAGGVAAIVFGFLFPSFATWTVTGIDSEAVFRMVLVFVAIAAFVSWRLQDSRVGRAWMAMREDEQIAELMGINVVTAKLLAFVIGAMLASLGGALFAVKIGTIFPSSFKIVQSIIILVIVIVGGMGSIRGVAIGALVLIGILGGPTQSGLLREFAEFKLLLYGVILVYMMLQRPEGLLPTARRSRELHQDEFLQDAWLKTQEGAAAVAEVEREEREG